MFFQKTDTVTVPVFSANASFRIFARCHFSENGLKYLNNISLHAHRSRPGLVYGKLRTVTDRTIPLQCRMSFEWFICTETDFDWWCNSLFTQWFISAVRWWSITSGAMHSLRKVSGKMNTGKPNWSGCTFRSFCWSCSWSGTLPSAYSVIRISSFPRSFWAEAFLFSSSFCSSDGSPTGSKKMNGWNPDW